MEKQTPIVPAQPGKRFRKSLIWLAAGVGTIGLMGLGGLPPRAHHWSFPSSNVQENIEVPVQTSLYGTFPQKGDPFQFIPCTDASRPPPLDDPTPQQSWAGLFDSDPKHWSWGSTGRGIFLCGYLDLPLDYHNSSDLRIVRISVTKFQVAGLPLKNDTEPSCSDRNKYKSERTLIIEPGGPGGSGSTFLWETAEETTERFSDGQFDVLGWDPRGVNLSLPSGACYPQDAHRDRWSLLSLNYREEAPNSQLEVLDAMNNATFFACQQRLGDFGRFVSTASVARDLDEIRKALGEEDVSGYFVSYGTGIGQTYVNMFPDRAGRLILDGTEYVRDHRLLGGFGWTALDNTTDAWNDGFLGECIKAGPEACALARPITGRDGPVTLKQLQDRMDGLLESLRARPQSAYTELGGPSLITYSALVDRVLYPVMYRPMEWPRIAQMLYELESGNSTLAAKQLDTSWSDNSDKPSYPKIPASSELELLVICSDAYDAPLPDGLEWWDELWANMTTQSWVAEVYRGDLNHTLKTPALLIASTYDPATPLRNGRRLLKEMGQNARLIVHNAYGHSSRRDPSDCTDRLAKDYVLNGILPHEQEVQCYANSKPYSQVPGNTNTQSMP
ncbi:unnamed protein product [Penicillium pancosmium]